MIIRDLVAGPRRFVELQRVLPGISTEQLRSRLNRMVADGLLTRQRYREVPPRVDYELTERARELMPVLGALARWGYDWVWSAPRKDEEIDVGAILRLAPGLLALRRGVKGSVAFAATGRNGAPRDYVLTAAGGGVTIEERKAPDADAHVRGSQRDWVAALGPDADRSRLKVEGDRKLAGALLDELAAVARSRAARAA